MPGPRKHEWEGQIVDIVPEGNDYGPALTLVVSVIEPGHQRARLVNVPLTPEQADAVGQSLVRRAHRIKEGD